MKSRDLNCERITSNTKPSPPTVFVIFGASGDLAFRKLIPALHSLYGQKLLPDKFYLTGAARTEHTDESFRELCRNSVEKSGQKLIESFLARCSYTSVNYHEVQGFKALSEAIETMEEQSGHHLSRVYYLAVPPSQYKPIVSRLSCCNLAGLDENGLREAHVIIEKPFGHNLESAAELSTSLRELLPEKRIFRMDHYLAKETVQNIMMLRFANAIFEPLWNRRYIDHVQITVAESIGIGYRAGYFDKTGTIRDMFQNHMLQMLALVAMEPPSTFKAESVRNEKVKLLKATRLYTPDRPEQSAITGQYTTSSNGLISENSNQHEDQEIFNGYLQEEGIPSSSRTETYAAMRLQIDNWRWQGVPFFLRAGKRMTRQNSEIALFFREVPHSIFSNIFPCSLPQNALILRVQPEQGVSLHIQAKKPGLGVNLSSLEMAFDYNEVFSGKSPEAYERLLLDCITGDQTLFVREDGMLASWEIITPVLKWMDEKSISPYHYPAGSDGPSEADKLLSNTDACLNTKRFWRSLK